MCNPRRIAVTATRELAEAWQHEVSRTATLSDRVVGEASVRQPLGATLGTPALRALEAALAAGDSGWREVPGGYRCDVEGGYALYHMEDQELEIVAVQEGHAEASGEASAVLRGEVKETLSVEGEGRYYDDGFGGRTKERAEEEAKTAARRHLDEAARDRVSQAQKQAETAAEADLRAGAEATARAALQRAAAEESAALARQAAGRLESVGLRCRQAFHALLARAYRDAILAYARRNRAENITCSEDGGVLEIEFHLQR